LHNNVRRLNIYAEDITQKVFILSLVDGKIKDFKNKSSLSTWLCGIANFLIRKEIYFHQLHDKLIRENVEEVYSNSHFNYELYQNMAEDHTCKGVGECHPYREFEGMQPSR
jgi:hypothetical protein